MFIDLGYKESTISGGIPKKTSKNKVYYPSLHIDKKELPITDKMVGKTITASVKLRVNSVEKRASKNGKTYSCSFDVLSMNIGGKKDISTMSKSELDQMERAEYENQRRKK